MAAAAAPSQIGLRINPLKTASTHVSPIADRTRKLLMHRHEIDKLVGKVERDGYTLIPTAAYWKGNKVKLELALAKGKQSHDKRQASKDRDWQRDKQIVMTFELLKRVWGRLDFLVHAVAYAPRQALEGAFVGTTTTDNDGRYGFTNLTPGSYSVRVAGGSEGSGSAKRSGSTFRRDVGSAPAMLTSA